MNGLCFRNLYAMNGDAGLISENIASLFELVALDNVGVKGPAIVCSCREQGGTYIKRLLNDFFSST